MSALHTVEGRRDILPSNATALERGVDKSLPQWEALADAVEPASMARQPEWIAHTAAEWQLVQFAPYFDNVADLLAAGRTWRMRRGSPASVRQALGWLGYDAITMEQDGFLLHIDPGRLVSNEDLLHLARVVRASLPLHERLYRLYHGEDRRALRYDGATRLDDALWDNDSGGWIDLDGEDPVKLAQFQRRTTLSQSPKNTVFTVMPLGIRNTVVTSADAMTYDAWAYDSEVMRDVSMGSTGITSTIAPQYKRLPPAVLSTEGRLTICEAPQAGSIAFGAGQSFGLAPIPLDNTRTWRGSWDSATWAIVCPTITTRLED